MARTKKVLIDSRLIIEPDDDCEDCSGWLRWRIVQLEVFRSASTKTGAPVGMASEQRQVVHHSITKLGARFWLWRHHRGELYYIQN